MTWSDQKEIVIMLKFGGKSCHAPDTISEYDPESRNYPIFHKYQFEAEFKSSRFLTDGSAVNSVWTLFNSDLMWMASTKYQTYCRAICWWAGKVLFNDETTVI